MIFLMNSAVMPAGNYGVYTYSPATVDDLVDVLNGEHGDWGSAIGYPQNREIIKKWTGVAVHLNRSETMFEEGDRALVMRLKKRVVDPQTKGMPVSEAAADWEFAWVEFSVGEAK